MRAQAQPRQVLVHDGLFAKARKVDTNLVNGSDVDQITSFGSLSKRYEPLDLAQMY